MSGARDVIVVGGGLVGAVAALGLAALGRRVVLIDRSRPETQPGRFGMDIRNIACSPASRAVLESVVPWDRFDAAGYERMVVWEELGTAAMTFTAREAGRCELGWILENGPTLEALWSAIEANERIEVVFGTVTGIAATAAGIEVEVDGRRRKGGLLLGVDGARSAVREFVKARCETLPTGQAALATVIHTAREHGNTAYQRFLKEGPLALLPGREPRYSSVVWSQTPEQATERQRLDERAFCATLTRASEGVLGEVLEVDHRVVFPLNQHLVGDFNPAPRVLLIGDAARVLHPLAGLGANAGFEDVRDLLARLAGLPAGSDPGAEGLWRAYARKRRLRAQLLVTAMSGFRHAYAGADPGLSWLRNTAVGWLDGAAPIKRQIMREALGLGPLAAGW